jgi:hypothetical protein
MLSRLRNTCNAWGFASIKPFKAFSLTTSPRKAEIIVWLVFMYHGIFIHMDQPSNPIEVERTQTGVRIEKRLLKVLKALAELKDMTLGDLLEGIVLHSFEGKVPFSPQTLQEIEQLRNIYGLTLHATDSHHLQEHP